MRPESLRLSVAVDGGRITAPRLEMKRQASPTALMRGRPPEDALSLVPLLFSLCGSAQQVAALEACEAAMGAGVSAPQKAARRLLVGAETLGELSLGVLRDWSELLGQPGRLEAARALRTGLIGLRAALGPGPWHLPGGARLKIDRRAIDDALKDVRAIVGEAIFGGAPIAAPRTWSDMGAGPAHDMLRHLYIQALEGFGASTIQALGPDLDDGPAETGPLIRRWDDPAVAEALSHHGNGLLARTTARLADIAATLREVEESATEVCDDVPTAPPSGRSGSGTARVEAARGILTHTITLEAGRIADWTIKAPTDWNFHADGPLVRGLADAPTGDDPERRVRLLVAALDPCVACEIEVRTDA